MKEIVARELAERVRDGEVLGIGTGSTVDAALLRIGQRVEREGLHVKVVPTSLESAWRCEELGLEVLHPNFRGELAWGFDGADEVDDRLWLIKGKGGALLREKILAVRCKHFIVIVDESKLVSQLGRTCPIPVELIPEAISFVEGELKARGATDVMLRPAGEGKHGPVITEMGNVIVDALFPQIDHALETDIKSIVGVVESGLFIDYADEVLIAGKDGVTSRRAK